MTLKFARGASYAAAWIRPEHMVGHSTSYGRITKRVVLGFRVTLRRST